MTAVASVAPPVAIVMLPVEQLSIGLDFRLDDDPAAVAELAKSIAEIGVLQPLTVRQVSSGWEVVAGRRRLAAARLADVEHVPCQLRTLTDDEAADIALAENLHRRDLSTIEEGLAYARLRDGGLTQTQIGERVGRSQAHVSMLLRVLELPEWLRQKIHRREISYVTALDRWGRKTRGPRGGGASTQSTGAMGSMTGRAWHEGGHETGRIEHDDGSAEVWHRHRLECGRLYSSWSWTEAADRSKTSGYQQETRGITLRRDHAESFARLCSRCDAAS